jgi:hypothetical protein
MFCKVNLCRHSDKHTTMGHQCGACKKYGHGNSECRNRNKIRKLLQYRHDSLPYNMRCNILDCINKSSHSTGSHHCKKCNGNHSASTCRPVSPLQMVSLECPICRVVNNIPDNQKKGFGLSEKCKVCFDNTIDVFLPTCGHMCLCTVCFDQMKT